MAIMFNYNRHSTLYKVSEWTDGEDFRRRQQAPLSKQCNGSEVEKSGGYSAVTAKMSWPLDLI